MTSHAVDDKHAGSDIEKHSDHIDHPHHHHAVEGDVDFHAAGLEGHAVARDEEGHVLAQIDKSANRRLVLKMDLFLTPIAFFMYLFCFIDRTNIGNANIAGLQVDLKMAGYQYNTALSMFYVAYIVFEIPSVLMCKIVGPGWWLPGCVFFFGLFTLAIGFVESYSALLAVRFLLGIAETALLPGLAFWMSRFYTKRELVLRLAFYIICAPLAGAFGGLLALGFEETTFGSYTTVNASAGANWRSIFIGEGIITMVIGLAAFGLMTDRPETARWLSPEQKLLAATRIKADAPATRYVTETLNKQAFKSGIFNVNSVVCGILFLLNQITIQGLTVFFPTILTALYPGTSVAYRQVKTIPPYIVGFVAVLFWSYMCVLFNRIGIFMMIGAVITVVAYAMYVGSTDVNVRYGASFLITIGAFAYGAMCNGWSSRNAAPDSARNAAISTTSFLGNLGGLIATWTYLPYMAPNYRTGHAVNIASASACFFLAGGLWLFQIRENRMRAAGKRDYRIAGKSEAEIAMLGHRHPEFRYTH